MQLTGAEIICECLLEQGVDTVFGYPGGAALNTYDALYKYSDKIRHILTAHEQGASHAADGYARATGKTGVVMTTSGRCNKHCNRPCNSQYRQHSACCNHRQCNNRSAWKRQLSGS